jgi:uncharacterized protein
MIPSELIELLCCPETKQPVAPAPPDLVGRLEAERAAGTLRTRAGTPISEPVTEALLRADGRVVYLIRDDIPVMLLDERVELEGQAVSRPATG